MMTRRSEPADRWQGANWTWATALLLAFTGVFGTIGWRLLGLGPWGGYAVAFVLSFAWLAYVKRRMERTRADERVRKESAVPATWSPPKSLPAADWRFLRDHAEFARHPERGLPWLAESGPTPCADAPPDDPNDPANNATLVDYWTKGKGSQRLERIEDYCAVTAPSFRCPRCGRRSYNPNDIREGYCGNCHDWTGEGTRQ
jgi:hypothetical protein